MRKKQQVPTLINTRVYGYWQALYMSLYSGQLYVDVAKRWRGFGFLYMLLLVAIASIPFSVRIIMDFNRYFNEQIISPIEQIPPLTIQNGTLIFDKEMPYLIKNKAGSVVVAIDTSGVVKGLDGAYPELMMLITQHKLYFRPPYTKLFLGSLNRATEKPFIETLYKQASEIFVAKEWIKASGVLKLKWFVLAMVYPMVFPFVFGLFYMFFLILAMLAQVFSWLIFKYKLTYKEATRLLTVASTAQVVIFLILLSANFLFHGVGLLAVILNALYFSYAVLSVKRESKMMVHS